MMNLVDYGSSDDSDDDSPSKETASDDSDASENEINDEKKVSSTKLPSAKDLLESSTSIGIQDKVLTNKFKAAEDQKIANLERHVKMVCDPLEI